MPDFTRYTPTGTPVAPENPVSLPVYLSHGVQLREAGAAEMTNQTHPSSTFVDANKTRRRRRGRKHKQASIASTGVAQRTIKKQAWNQRPRAPPPPPRNTNAYLMAAAAARSKAEHGDLLGQESSVVASPGRSCTSTCYGGGGAIAAS